MVVRQAHIIISLTIHSNLANVPKSNRYTENTLYNNHEDITIQASFQIPFPDLL
eukprot:m.121174 g.121174  ORF g.121174 m.121174 type:complete len:54 (-) comp14383_c0_seq1:140-301(-)